jgi:hypothetical protein
MLLGAVNGLISSVVLVLIERVASYDAEVRERAATAVLASKGHLVCGTHPNPMWWVLPSLWHIVLFIVASILVHRFLAKRDQSVFMLWQVVSCVVLAEWLITVTVGASIDYLSGFRSLASQLSWAIEQAFSPRVLTFIALVFAVNVVFGTIMQMAQTHYSERHCVE